MEHNENNVGTAAVGDPTTLLAPNSPIAKRIAAKRSELKLSVKDVADHLGLSAQSIYFYEKGEREPTGENLFALADLLGVSARWIVLGDEDGTAKPITLPPGLHPVVAQSLACLTAFLATGATSVNLVHAAIRLLESGEQTKEYKNG
jgi:transcriptional regulator with XRE-family HTH domain